MNVLLSPQPPHFSHPHQHDSTARLSSSRPLSPYTANMTNRKRRLDDDGDEMAVSPTHTNQLRTVLERICDRHPEIGQEVVTSAPARPLPPPSVVKQPLASASLQYLDGATKVIHALPDWDSQSHRHHKDNAYEEIAKAWALVISEAAKRGGGFVLHSGGWDQRLARHNELSGNRLEAAINAMASSVGWIGNASPMAQSSSNDPASIRNQLMSGTYGSPVKVGPW
ncbi:unnamed protein product [Parascedosporium putredinis]|uniref:Tethering factor for nuclear proteasome STS1 n=1 Tax=Parascedosporium putredinis TaxID=1442378 RepID=A0A9P1H3K8_9PEZI|nr:unnamed protein product [Parascedosporium putredinis]CAI7995919.1 unnamed protein product [Parascedosporium putredinis]